MTVRAVAFAALCASSLCLAVPAGAAGAPVQPQAGGGLSSAARNVLDCTQRSGRLLVDIEIDRSASLAQSDPEGRRVDGVGAALLGLARLAGRSRSGERPPPRIEVLLSSFAGTVSPRRSGDAWRTVDDGSLDGLIRQAERYGARDRGRDTDYALALAAARSALDARAAAVSGDDGPQPCKALLFLSDGRFHLGNRSDSAALPPHVFYAPGVNLDQRGGGGRAVRAGRHFLCDPGALRDRMVGEGIVMFTVALSASGGFRQVDREFLEALTTGKDGREVDCGTRLSSRTGDFIEVRDSRELFFAFGRVGYTPGPGCPPDCPNPNEFTTVPGLTGFLISATAPLPGVELAITGPSGETATFSGEGTAEVALASASIQQHWIRSRSMEIEADFDTASRDWLGPWQFRFFTPGDPGAPVPAYVFSLQSDLRPEIVGQPGLLRGGSTDVELRLVDHDGAVGDGPLVRAARLSGAAVDGGGAARPLSVRSLGAGRFETTVEVPEDAPDGAWSMNADLSYPQSQLPIEPGYSSLHLPEPATKASEPPPPGLLRAVLVVFLVMALIALAIVYRRRVARSSFTAPQVLRALECAATVFPGSRVALHPDPGEPDYFAFEPLTRRGRDAKQRSFKSEPFAFRAKLSWRLGARPTGTVTARGGRQLLGGDLEGPLVGNEARTWCRVPLDLAGIWLLAVDSIDDDGLVHGRLIVFTDENAAVDVGPRTLAAARAALPAEEWEGFETRLEEESGGGRRGGPFKDIDDVGWDAL